MKYLMQVKIEDPLNPSALVWKSVKASHLKSPYEFDTREEAEKILRICYGAAVSNDRLRVIEKP